MVRIIDKANLTFKEIQIILRKIEAILNSRSITPISTDLSNLAYISPSHFL